MSDTITNRKEAIRELAGKIKDIRFAMLTTLEQDGELRSRPMATQDMDDDGTLWFFTQASSPKVDEATANPQVNLAYADPDKNLWVSVTATTRLTQDRAIMERLWKPFLKAWFPDGLDSPDIALLEVTPHHAEYWEGPASGAGRVVQIAKAIVTRGQEQTGKDVKLELE